MAIDDAQMTVETTSDDAAIRAQLGMTEPAETPEPDADVEAAAEPVEDAVEEPTPAPEPEAPKRPAKPRDSMQARLSQETQRRHAAERQAQEAQQRIAALEQQFAQFREQQTPKPQQPQQPQKATYPPVLQSFDAYVAQHPNADWDAYQDARVEWRTSQIDVSALVRQQFEQERQRLEGERLIAAHGARVEEAKKKYADWADALNAGDAALKEAGVDLSAFVRARILEHPQSADVLHYLGTHPDECIQLARSTAGLTDAAAVPLVRLALDRLVSAGASHGAATTVLTNAKPPIKPLGASHVTPSTDDYSDDEPFEKHFARENARDRKRGRL